MQSTKKALDIVVVGELNADLIFTGLPGLPEMGSCKLARDMEFTLGSASAIFASNCAKLGMKVGFISKIGNDFVGEFVRDRLIEGNVDCSFIMKDDHEKTGVCVSLSFPDDYAMASYAGVRETMTIEDIDFDYLKTAGHLHLSSYYLQTGMISGCAELFKVAKESGMTTSLDPDSDATGNWDDSIFNVLRYVDVFMPNAHEAMSISGTKDLRNAAEKLASTVKTVVIKNGSEGVVAKNGATMIAANAFDTEVVDTTGAGDSFNAGFIFQYLRKAPLAKCLVWGNACAAISTTKRGGTTAFPEMEEVNDYLCERKQEQEQMIHVLKG